MAERARIKLGTRREFGVKKRSTHPGSIFMFRAVEKSFINQ